MSELIVNQPIEKGFDCFRSKENIENIKTK